MKLFSKMTEIEKLINITYIVRQWRKQGCSGPACKYSKRAPSSPLRVRLQCKQTTSYSGKFQLDIKSQCHTSKSQIFPLISDETSYATTADLSVCHQYVTIQEKIIFFTKQNVFCFLTGTVPKFYPIGYCNILWVLPAFVFLLTSCTN